ncbi:MBL fold metallo-hydrolase [Silvibacterium sp.]|uniref:MBL fold metallo-hydrolase n=1 Tax=Silvibacterium sp. TaxID=1964179 RepID=UPI0039E5A1EC
MSIAEDVRLTYIGGPTVLIEFGGLRLLTDPTFDAGGNEYTAGPVTLYKIAGPAVEASSLGALDAVLLSHEHHSDNLDHAGRQLLSQAGAVLTTPDAAERLNGAGSGGNAVGLAPWQTTTLTSPSGRRLHVTGTPARHGSAEADRGPVTGFLLAFDDAPEDVLYVSGDTVWFEGVEEIVRRFPSIRVAILFLGAAKVVVNPAHLTFKAEEAVRFSQALPKTRIVPAHFEGWKHFTESRAVIAAAFAAGAIEDRLTWLTPGVATSVSS